MSSNFDSATRSVRTVAIHELVARRDSGLTARGSTLTRPLCERTRNIFFDLYMSCMIPLVVELREPPYFDRWLSSLPDAAAAQVLAGIEYLVEFGRGAQLDAVRHRIQTSRHYPDMSEIRILHHTRPHDLVLRVLTVFTNRDQTLVVCLGGDKASWQRVNNTDWYDHAVPIADQIFDLYQQHPF
jgi:hypothetical protein